MPTIFAISSPEGSNALVNSALSVSFTIAATRSGTFGCAFFMDSMTWSETITAICMPSEPAPVAWSSDSMSARNCGSIAWARAGVDRMHPASVSAAISSRRGTWASQSVDYRSLNGGARSNEDGALLLEQGAQDRTVAERLVGAIAADRKIRGDRQRREQAEQMHPLGGGHFTPVPLHERR